MGSYLLRNIDPALWQKVKTKADGEGRKVRAVILRLLTTWVKK